MNRIQVEFEFLFVCSMPMLYGFLTTPEGLQSWFCKEVMIEGDVYTFIWEGGEESAKCSANNLLTEIKYDWMGRDQVETTTFMISKSPITRETLLQIVTTCDQTEEAQEHVYWENAIQELKHATGG